MTDVMTQHVSQQRTSPPRSPEHKSIYKELLDLGVPNDIAEYADVIYQQIIATHGKNKIKNMINFYCLYNALREKGHAPIPKDVAKIVGMDESKIYKVSTFYPARNYIEINYLKYIPSICEKIGIDTESANQIIEFGKKFEKFDIINQKPPHMMAAGVVLTFITVVNGMNYDLDRFVDQTGLSSGAVKECNRIISDLFNKI